MVFGSKLRFRYLKESNMGDIILKTSLEELISMAIDCYETNTVDFKMIQTILHILARQMRMLGQQVEIRVSDLESEEDGRRRKKSEPAEARKKDKKGDKSPKTTEQKDKAQKEEKPSNKDKSKYGKKTKEGTHPEFHFFKQDASKVREDSGSSINVSEVDRKNEKVLVVERGGRTQRSDSSRSRVGSIEVVTLSQFEILKDAVNDLMEKTGPIPAFTLPDNQKLRADIAKGSASLTDTMQAMQVNGRVKAAEQAIDRMTGLLTQLAAAGALPQDMVGKISDLKLASERVEEGTASLKSRSPMPGSARKTVAIDPNVDTASQGRMEGGHPAGSQKSVTLTSTEQPSVGSHSRPPITSRAPLSSVPLVTHTELNNAMQDMKAQIMKDISNMTSRANAVAETASTTAKSVADRLDVAITLDKRISTLYSLVTDYAEQLSGFDAGLVTSMQSFQEQMMQMRHDLKNGLAVIDGANKDGETAAVMELTERCEGLASDLEQTVHAHHDLIALQGQLSNELKSLVECVEMLREQKADRDEVLDGLRDKADTSRLSGLLPEEHFAIARKHLEGALNKCYDKFQQQETVWMDAMKDLAKITEGKAEILELFAARDNAQSQLRELDQKLYQLAIQIGEPKTAMLTRALARDARCGACAVPAMMEVCDASSNKPPLLPALRPPPPPPSPPPQDTPSQLHPPCKPHWMIIEPTQTSGHVCRRWAGGSHTLVTVREGAATRDPAPHSQLDTTPTRHFTGYGNDGRMYMMEEEMQPCAECNKLSTDVVGAREAAADGAGDRGPRPSTVVIQ